MDGQQFDYRFDDIGNRKNSGGRLSSVSTNTVNRLNQYTQRGVPDKVDVMGIANPTASVTVNGNTASRKGEYYHYALTVANSSAQYPTVTVSSQYGATQSESGEVFVPAATEQFSHDADGNLIADGRWNYELDGENRLVVMRSMTNSPAPERRIVFEYDFQGRRIRETVWNNRTNGLGSELSDKIFVYDRWNVVAELDAKASNAKLRTYIWGLDLSGSRHGAGGVGGLLKVTDYVGGTTHHFVSYDGNGNVTGLHDAANGNITAVYEYGPFGEPIRVTGSMGKLNPFRWSTKHTDDETGLVYYGYRYYNPNTGRWLSRDRIGEQGGENLHSFCLNNPNKYFDFLGEFDNIFDNIDFVGGFTDSRNAETHIERRIDHEWKPCPCGETLWWVGANITQIRFHILYSFKNYPAQLFETIAHELVHVRIGRDTIVAIRQDLYPLMKKCREGKCLQTTKRFIDAAKSYHFANENYENASFDCRDYKGPFRMKRCADKNLDKIVLDYHAAEYNLLRKEMDATCAN